MSEEINVTSFDFKITELSKEALIDEILMHQREVLQGMEVDNLRANVIDLRVNAYKRKLTEEAGLIITQFGYTVKEKKDEDDDAEEW